MGKISVFLVSKDEIEARTLAEAFGKLDIRLSWIQGKNTALARSLVSPPNLFLHSVDPTDADPLEVLRRFRAEHALAETWFFLIVSQITRETAAAAKSAGVNGILIKPFDASALIERIQKHTGVNFLSSALRSIKEWERSQQDAATGG